MLENILPTFENESNLFIGLWILFLGGEKFSFFEEIDFSVDF